MCLLAFTLVLTLNRQTIYLSFGALLLAAVYPFTKRYTQLPQVVLGAAFGWAIPMAFAAVQGEVPRIAWLLFTVNVLWSTVYDTFYAMVDRDDDVKIGVKSTAILFGESDLLIVGVLQILMLAGLILVGQLADLGRYFYLGLLVAAGLSLYQQYLARRRDRDGCFQAFLNNNALGACVFLGILAALSRRGRVTNPHSSNCANIQRAFPGTVRAHIQASTVSTPASRSTSANASRVLPVVMTSSTKATCRASTGRVRAKAPRRLRRRCAAGSRDWAGVARVRLQLL